MTTPMATGWQQVGQFTPLSWTLRPTSGSITAAVGELVRASAANGSIDIAPPSSPQDGGSILIIRTDSVLTNVVRFTGPVNGSSGGGDITVQWGGVMLTYDATNAVWLRTGTFSHLHPYLDLTTDQSVGGVKTFTGSVRVPSPSNAADAVRHDDARLTNARTPTAHASTHGSAGSDPITPAAIGAATSGHSHALAAHKSTHATGGSDALAPADIGAAAASHAHALADLPVAASGTSSATALVRADDSRLSNPRAPTSHAHTLADLPVAASGSSSATALVRADDARLSDARTALAHAASHATGGGDAITPGSIGAAVDSEVMHLGNITETVTGAKWFNIPPRVGVGDRADNPVRRDDARLTDARTPTAHAASHGSGGSDPVTPAAIGAASSTHSHATPAHASTHASGGSDPLTPAQIGAASTVHTHPNPAVPTPVAMVVASGTATPQAAGGAQVHRLSTAAAVTVAVPDSAVDVQPWTHEITNTASASVTITLASGYEVGGTGRTRSVTIRAGATAYLFGRMRGTTARLLSVDDGG